MANPRFIHLHVHSDYSIIDGLVKVGKLVQTAATMRMPALAITDFTNLCGLVKLYKSAQYAGIKPIIGADFLVKSSILGKELAELTLIAANNVGYHNLKQIIYHAYKEKVGCRYSAVGPILDSNWLITKNEGLIVLSGGRNGDVGKYLIRGNRHKLEQCLSFYQQYFPDRYYLELIRTGRKDEDNYLDAAVELAKRKGIPVVATNDVRFINKADFDAHKIRVAIHHGSTIHDLKQQGDYSSQQYMRSTQEMCNLFADLPEALTNSVEIARRCNVTISLGKYFLPQFPTGKKSTAEFMVQRSYEGLEERLANSTNKPRKKYYERLNTELQVINKMGFPGYFLIVMEFIQWAKKNGIPVGPGRGSGAGSLVAYAIKITDIDPLEFDLLFERFLNPERVSMPDFDVDFCMEKRDLVIDHVADTYGRDAVSQIITFGTMAAKAAIRDVGRALGHPYRFVDRLSKLVPLDPGMTLEKALANEQKLKTLYHVNEEVKELIDMARQLEGVTRNASKHAGGVVIAPTKITDFAPLCYDAEGRYPVTQFDKHDIEEVGLVKFDFLGLRTLTIINLAIKMINIARTRYGLPQIAIATIPRDDKKSFELLQRAETTAVFQLESRGMKELIKRLQPDCFEDIIALVALFRPGPLQTGMVDNFINRKHGREAISYPDKKWQHILLQPVLESTYGIILYQEQVMQIAQVLAGYTLGDADLLRRAIGKKKLDDMAQQRSIFKAGAERIGIDGELAMKIFDVVEKFACYGFNKSHSTAYALVSYQTLWLKAHYPAEFLAAAMTTDMDNTEKVVLLIDECWRLGVKVLPPDINKGQYCFQVNEHGEIVYGLGAIKGVGEVPIDAIIEARDRYGSFKALFDLCVQTDRQKLNRRVLEQLIMSGALDSLGPHRAAIMSTLSSVLKAADQHKQAKAIGQADFFGVCTNNKLIFDTSSYSVAPCPEHVLLEWERNTLGLYLTGHKIR